MNSFYLGTLFASISGILSGLFLANNVVQRSSNGNLNERPPIITLDVPIKGGSTAPLLTELLFDTQGKSFLKLDANTANAILLSAKTATTEQLKSLWITLNGKGEDFLVKQMVANLLGRRLGMASLELLDKQSDYWTAQLRDAMFAGACRERGRETWNQLVSDEGSTKQLRNDFIAAWSAFDPAEAIRVLSGADIESNEKTGLREVVLTHWATTDAAGMLKEFEGSTEVAAVVDAVRRVHSQGLTRPDGRYINSQIARQLAASVSAGQELPSTLLRGSEAMLAEIMNWLPLEDPVGAAFMAGSMEVLQKSSAGRTALISALISTQPESAWSQWRMMTNKLLRPEAGLVAIIFQEWAAKDPKSALVEMSRGENAEIITQNNVSSAMARVAIDQPTEIITIINDSKVPPAFKQLAKDSLIGTLAEFDPQRLIELTKAEPSLNLSEAQSQTLLERLATKNPTAAIEWGLQQNWQKDPTQLYDLVVGAWTKTDPLTASKWVNDMEPGPTKDAAIVGLVRGTLAVDPESALIWSTSIQDPAQRRVQFKIAIQELDKLGVNTETFKEKYSAAMGGGR